MTYNNFKIKNMKHFDKIKLFSMVCFVVFSLFVLSCKQDQRMPQLNTSKQSDSYDENAPKTTVGIDEIVKFNFSENEVRAISLDQTQATGSKGAYQRPQLKWVVGDKYRFYATVRYVNTTNQNDWKPNFSDNGMWIEVIKVSPDGRSGEFRIRGEMQINSSYIKGASTTNPSLQPYPDNWYIGGFIGGKLDATGTRITDDLGVEPIYEYTNKGIKGIRMKENKFVAVDPKAQTFNMNVPLGVPLSKVILKDYGPKIYVHIPEDKPLQLKPLGTVFCVQVKNGLVHSVAIPKNNSSVKIKSRFLTATRLQFDLWHHQKELSKVGTPDFSIHHVYNGNYDPTPDEWGRTEASVSIDWSQYPKSYNNTDAVLDMDDCVNLYLWSVWNDFFGGRSGFENYIELDFSGLNLKTPMYGDYVGFGGFSPMNSAKVTYYGGADVTTRNKWRTSYPNKTVDFLSTKVNTSRANINKESTVFSRFTIQSELLISEVYFDWSGENNGMIEIFNPNSTDVDLSDYYLMRMDYSDNTCMFVGPFGTRTDRLQCGLLMPLNLNNTIEFTPGTADKRNIHYHKRDNWTDYGEVDVPNTCFSQSLLFAPHDKNINLKINSLYKGMTMCIAGHGIYNLISNNQTNNRNPDLDKGVYGTGMLSKIKPVLKRYIVSNYNNTPQYLGLVWGVVDGELNKKINASANDEAAGVTARDASNGWALVKKIENKYYIIDSFGPTWLTPSSGGITAQGFRELMNEYKGKYPKNNFDMIRKDNIVFPNGGMVGPSMDDEWSMKQDPAWEVSIGARSRYDNATGGGAKIPYFFGGR